MMVLVIFAYRKIRFIFLKILPPRRQETVSIPKHRHELLKLKSGSARVLGYTVYRGFLNRVYGILQFKYGYSVYHFL